MEAGQALSAFLQVQLSVDASSASHLPFILSTLSESSFVPSPHLVKWINRVSSLMRSSDPSAQWAGLCLASKTAQYSKKLLVESAQSWIAAVMTIITKADSLPVIKAAIRLAHLTFTACMDLPEFQRHIAIPNVSKFTIALIELGEKTMNLELKTLCLRTLASLTVHYPSLNRSAQSAMSSLSLKLLGGSSPAPLNNDLVKSASRLFSVLHHTGGKVASSNLWRNAVDETLAFAWSSFAAARIFFRSNTQAPRGLQDHQLPQDSLPLKVDGVRCCIIVLCDLLKSRPSRLVLVPIGSLTELAVALLKCTTEDKPADGADPNAVVYQRLALPSLWQIACDLLCALSQSVQHHLTPHSPEIISYLTYHLEQEITPRDRLAFVRTLHVILANSLPISSPFLPNRMAKALLPHLTPVLSDRDLAGDQNSVLHGAGTKRGRKRAKEYEGDRALRTQQFVVYPSEEGGFIALETLDVIKILLNNPDLGATLQSISSRVLLSMLLALPRIVPSALSPDRTFHLRLYRKVESVCAYLSMGTSTVMSRTVPMVLKASLAACGNVEDVQSLEILVHPRLPPLLRPQPPIEHLALTLKEESREEADTRTQLGLIAGPNMIQTIVQSDDQLATDTTIEPKMVTQQTISTAPPVATPLPQFILPMQEVSDELSSSGAASRDIHDTPPIPDSPKSQPTRSLSSVKTTQPMVVDDEMPSIDMESDSEAE